MCIGLPMQIKETGFGYAKCEGMGVKRTVDTLLIGDQPIGTWVLVFLGSAREVLTPEDAQKITDAVTAVDLIMSGNGQLSTQGMEENSIDALFADLIDREPQKPPSLIAFEESQRKLNGE
ncbi:MAG TPA: HypC/HybG/HupF family hydrogenase formation chaperone [Cycloclasticus sp.]|nr:HypC/HybG/HupF family hydrogenase formation chaperone [Cycloclasticus sp.]HIL91976.1 HypC/HybG/HupF family hydrogenase formation chaperone [Cycloclasticus sp.]